MPLCPWLSSFNFDIVQNTDELIRAVKSRFDKNLEGAIIRRLDAPYLCGQSTIVDEVILKCLNLKNEEATIIGFEQMIADNGVDKLPYCGALILLDNRTGIQFNCGTGLTEAQRKHIWNNQLHYLDKVVRYQYKPVGVVEKPRSPVYIEGL